MTGDFAAWTRAAALQAAGCVLPQPPVTVLSSVSPATKYRFRSKIRAPETPAAPSSAGGPSSRHNPGRVPADKEYEARRHRVTLQCRQTVTPVNRWDHNTFSSVSNSAARFPAPVGARPRPPRAPTTPWAWRTSLSASLSWTESSCLFLNWSRKGPA